MSQVINIRSNQVLVSRDTVPVRAIILMASPGLPPFEAQIYMNCYDTPQDYETAIQRTVEAAQMMLSALAGLPDSRIGGIL